MFPPPNSKAPTSRGSRTRRWSCAACRGARGAVVGSWGSVKITKFGGGEEGLAERGPGGFRVAFARRGGALKFAQEIRRLRSFLIVRRAAENEQVGVRDPRGLLGARREDPPGKLAR